MTLTKHDKNHYSLLAKGHLYTGDSEYIIEKMIAFQVKESEITMVLQQMVLTDHKIANFGDIYKEFLFIK